MGRNGDWSLLPLRAVAATLARSLTLPIYSARRYRNLRQQASEENRLGLENWRAGITQVLDCLDFANSLTPAVHLSSMECKYLWRR